MANFLHGPAGLDTIRLGWTLIHFLWQGMLIAFFLEIALLMAGRRNASLRYLLCALALAAMPVCLAGTYFFLGRAPVAAASAASLAVPLPHVTFHQAAFTSFGLLPELHTITEFASRGILTLDLNSWLPGIVTVWLVGILLLSIRKAGGLIVLSRWRRHEVYAPNEAMCELCRQACVKIGVDPRRIYLGISNLIEVPMTMGWLRPVILFPANLLTGLSVMEIELLLAHELAHIRRCDYLVNLVQIAVETLFFYHPITWWISRRMRQERENSCDDLVTAGTRDVVVYAHALFQLETLRLSVDEMLVPAASGGNLLQRIQRLAGEPARKSETVIVSLLTSFLIISALVTVFVFKGHSLLPMMGAAGGNHWNRFALANSETQSLSPNSLEETIYQDDFRRTGELDGSSPGVIDKTGASWRSSTGENQYRTSGHGAELSASAYAYSVAYLPVNGTSGITLDGKKDFTLSVVVVPGSGGRTGISLNTGTLERYSNLYTHCFATLSTCSAFAGAYAFDDSKGLNIRYCYASGAHGPTRISLSYNASARTLTYRIGATVLHVQTSVQPEQVAAIRSIGLGNDGFNSSVATSQPNSSRSAPTFANFMFTLRDPGESYSALASAQ